jgi:hypothetical protein
MLLQEKRPDTDQYRLLRNPYLANIPVILKDVTYQFETTNNVPSIRTDCMLT